MPRCTQMRTAEIPPQLRPAPGSWIAASPTMAVPPEESEVNRGPLPGQQIIPTSHPHIHPGRRPPQRPQVQTHVSHKTGVKHPAPPAYPGSHRSTGGNANSSLFASRIPTQAPTEVGPWRCVGRSTRGHTRSRWSRVWRTREPRGWNMH